MPVLALSAENRIKRRGGGGVAAALIGIKQLAVAAAYGREIVKAIGILFWLAAIRYYHYKPFVLLANLWLCSLMTGHNDSAMACIHRLNLSGGKWPTHRLMKISIPAASGG